MKIYSAPHDMTIQERLGACITQNQAKGKFVLQKYEEEKLPCFGNVLECESDIYILYKV